MALTVESTIRERSSNFLIKWTPRMISVGIGGYYGLGLAYEFGLMASVDKVAIRMIKYFFGYVGVGALMPTAQWYAAWAVRLVVGLGAGIIYDLSERCTICCASRLSSRSVSSGPKRLAC